MKVDLFIYACYFKLYFIYRNKYYVYVYGIEDETGKNIGK